MYVWEGTYQWRGSKTRPYLFQHGESAYNVLGRIGGDADLSIKGELVSDHSEWTHRLADVLGWLTQFLWEYLYLTAINANTWIENRYYQGQQTDFASGIATIHYRWRILYVLHWPPFSLQSGPAFLSNWQRVQCKVCSVLMVKKPSETACVVSLVSMLADCRFIYSYQFSPLSVSIMYL